MAYQKQFWQNLPDESTSIDEEKLNHMEDGIANSVDLDSEQSITGSKDFKKIPTCSLTPSNSNDLVNKKYVDEKDVDYVVVGTYTGED